MSYVNTLLPVVDVDRKPFPFPVSETAAALYGFSDSGLSSSSAVEIGPSSSHSPFVAASEKPPWHRLQPQSKRSWCLEPGLDQSDCKIQPSLGHPLPSAVPEAISPSVVQPSYGHRTLDTGGIASGLFLSHSSNRLPQTVRNDLSLPASCHLSNASKSCQLCILTDYEIYN